MQIEFSDLSDLQGYWYVSSVGKLFLQKGDLIIEANFTKLVDNYSHSNSPFLEWNIYKGENQKPITRRKFLHVSYAPGLSGCSIFENGVYSGECENSRYRLNFEIDRPKEGRIQSLWSFCGEYGIIDQSSESNKFITLQEFDFIVKFNPIKVLIFTNDQFQFNHEYLDIDYLIIPCFEVARSTILRTSEIAEFWVFDSEDMVSQETEHVKLKDDGMVNLSSYRAFDKQERRFSVEYHLSESFSQEVHRIRNCLVPGKQLEGNYLQCRFPTNSKIKLSGQGKKIPLKNNKIGFFIKQLTNVEYDPFYDGIRYFSNPTESSEDVENEPSKNISAKKRFRKQPILGEEVSIEGNIESSSSKQRVSIKLEDNSLKLKPQFDQGDPKKVSDDSRLAVTDEEIVTLSPNTKSDEELPPKGNLILSSNEEKSRLFDSFKKVIEMLPNGIKTKYTTIHLEGDDIQMRYGDSSGLNSIPIVSDNKGHHKFCRFEKKKRNRWKGHRAVCVVELHLSGSLLHLFEIEPRVKKRSVDHFNTLIINLTDKTDTAVKEILILAGKCEGVWKKEDKKLKALSVGYKLQKHNSTLDTTRDQLIRKLKQLALKN